MQLINLTQHEIIIQVLLQPQVQAMGSEMIIVNPNGIEQNIIYEWFIYLKMSAPCIWFKKVYLWSKIGLMMQDNCNNWVLILTINTRHESTLSFYSDFNKMPILSSLLCAFCHAACWLHWLSEPNILIAIFIHNFGENVCIWWEILCMAFI